MFKNREEYLAMRAELMAEAQKLIDSGDVAGANQKIDEVKKLDADFEEWRTAQANLAAMNNRTSVTPYLPQEGNSLQMNAGNADRESDADSDQYRQAWIHSMKGMALSADERKMIDSVNSSIKMENAETASGHTLLIPTTVRKGIWERAAEEHPAISAVLPMHIQGDIVIIKDTSSDSDADWLDESESSKDAEFAEGKIVLSGCELAKSVSISWKLKKMNDQEYEAYLIRKLGTKVGNAIAKALFYGKGKPGESDTFKPQMRGVITALDAQENTPREISYSGNITYKNMTELFALMKSAYLTGSAIYARGTTIWTKLANIVDENKRPIFIPDVTAVGVGHIFGITVKAEDGVGENDVVIANFGTGYVVNFNEEMTVYTEDHVKVRVTDYMAYGIVDGDLITEDCFAVLKQQAASGGDAGKTQTGEDGK